jgi:hypothetical protein
MIGARPFSRIEGKITMQNHLNLLGWKVEDKVTGFVGVVTHIGMDLYGCVQAIVSPSVVVEKTGSQTMVSGSWFDTVRLTKIGTNPVMAAIPMKGDLEVAGADINKPTK